MELTSVYKVKEWMIQEINSGALKPGDHLPSNLYIARKLNVMLCSTVLGPAW